MDAIFVHIFTIVTESPSSNHPEFIDGARTAVAEAVDYGLASIEQGAEWSDAVPLGVVTQARRSAQSGVGLSAALARYIAGHARLSAFVVEEIERSGLSSEQSLALLLEASNALSSLLRRILASVTNTYLQERDRITCPHQRRRAELVECLLSGGQVDSRELGYELDTHHVGVLAWGDCAEAALQGLASRFDCQLLAVPRADGTIWAWFGGPQALSLADTEESMDTKVQIAIGAPAPRVAGFRITHRQAQAAFRVAQRGQSQVLRFADVGFESLALQDIELASSLVGIHLTPLEPEQRRTLRAYFKHRRQSSTAGAALGVERRTVSHRLGKIEDRLGYPLDTRLAELEIALRLDELLNANDPSVFGSAGALCTYEHGNLDP